MPPTTAGYRMPTPTAVAALIGMLMILTVLAALLIPTTADAQPDPPIRISDDYCPLSNLA